MSKINAIGSFILKYADEAASIATALTNVLDGLALPRAQADKVRETIEKLETAAENIGKSTANIDVRISKSDIEAAVGAYLDKNLKPMVEAFIAEKRANENADSTGANG